jgi:hypothetical protein
MRLAEELDWKGLMDPNIGICNQIFVARNGGYQFEIFQNERNCMVYKDPVGYSLITGIFEYAVVWVCN